MKTWRRVWDFFSSVSFLRASLTSCEMKFFSSVTKHIPSASSSSPYHHHQQIFYEQTNHRITCHTTESKRTNECERTMELDFENWALFNTHSQRFRDSGENIIRRTFEFAAEIPNVYLRVVYYCDSFLPSRSPSTSFRHYHALDGKAILKKRVSRKNSMNIMHYPHDDRTLERIEQHHKDAVRSSVHKSNDSIWMCLLVQLSAYLNVKWSVRVRVCGCVHLNT